MKLKNLFALLILSLCFVACDSDNNKPNNVAPMIEGTYNGTLKTSVMGKLPDTQADVKIKANTNGTVTIVLPKYAGENPMMQLPSLSVPNIKVSSAKDGMYVIAETAIDQSIKDIKYVGKISGTVKDKMLDLKYNIKPGKMPFNINYTFTGKK